MGNIYLIIIQLTPSLWSKNKKPLRQGLLKYLVSRMICIAYKSYKWLNKNDTNFSRDLEQYIATVVAS